MALWSSTILDRAINNPTRANATTADDYGLSLLSHHVATE